MALDATVSGAASNSFVTRAEANTYFGDRSYVAEWTAATDAAKDAALVTASRRVDEEQFVGGRTTLTQALQWPRHDTYTDDGVAYDSAAIPARVKEAVFMCALEILKTDFLQQNYLANYSFLQSGTVSFKQFQPGTSGRLPDAVQRLLRGLILGYGGSLRIVRG